MVAYLPGHGRPGGEPLAAPAGTDRSGGNSSPLLSKLLLERAHPGVIHADLNTCERKVV